MAWGCSPPGEASAARLGAAWPPAPAYTLPPAVAARPHRRVLTLASTLANAAFVTFTSSVPLWLVHEHGLATDDRLIGWTLAAFSLAAGLGSLPGGVLVPRLGRGTVLVGSLVAAAVPLLSIVMLEPGGMPYFIAAALAGAFSTRAARSTS
ncbi:MFS transporter [Nonomuraea sp. NPDC051941]|uniref:MFS transporter n=1 Tax=Nonomuraea sp. NPDC051941 TaxID=3364373 RepID=UPI0037C5AE01